MEITLSYVHAIDAPKSLDNRKSFYFSDVSEISAKPNEFGNYEVKIVSDELPRVRYLSRVRPAEDEDLIQHCVRHGNSYTFPQVQQSCVEFEKSWF